LESAAKVKLVIDVFLNVIYKAGFQGQLSSIISKEYKQSLLYFYIAFLGGFYPALYWTSDQPDGVGGGRVSQ
jgi:hypothetical protein